MIDILKENKSYAIFLGVLLVLALVAKSILILNEETLIVFCFSGVVVSIARSAGATIASELEDRANLIKKEFTDYYNTKRNLLITLWYYNQDQVSLLSDINLICKFTTEQIRKILQHREKALVGLINIQLNEKLNFLHVKETALRHSIQAAIVQNFSNSVLAEFTNNTTGKEQRELLLEEAVTLIESIKTK